MAAARGARGKRIRSRVCSSVWSASDARGPARAPDETHGPQCLRQRGPTTTGRESGVRQARVGAKLGAIRCGSLQSSVDTCGHGGLAFPCRMDSHGPLRTPLGDLRIRRLGVRVAPGAPRKSLAVATDSTCHVFVEGFEQGDLWEPFARSDHVDSGHHPVT